jgi:uncharacterized repeat protein (TIGR03837 family)
MDGWRCSEGKSVRKRMRVWDIFCRVVDNYGDAGVCWRLARQLAAEHGVRPRLWIDEPRALAVMRTGVDAATAVQTVQGVEVRLWPAGEGEEEGGGGADDAIADVVIEAFACELPAAYVRGMAGRETPPVWLNLEYLSAEAWVEGTHGLASPQSVETARGKVVLNKVFFFPGFTGKTGGLPRERGLLEARAAFQADAAAQEAYWAGLGVPGRAMSPEGEVRISLFAYENAEVEGLLAACAAGPTPVRLLVPEGRVLPQVLRFFGGAGAGAVQAGAGLQWSRGALAAHVLPFTDQPGYDRLLWACDWNFVRGEDSFVRAQWAARPFVWQIYPQAEAAHQVKLSAFWRLYAAGAGALDPAAAAGVEMAWAGWNGMAALGLPAPDWGAVWARMLAGRPMLQAHAREWARELATQADLAAQLVEFAAKVPK